MCDSGTAQVDNSAKLSIQRQKVWQAGVPVRKADQIRKGRKRFQLSQDVGACQSCILPVEIGFIHEPCLQALFGLKNAKVPMSGERAVLNWHRVYPAKSFNKDGGGIFRRNFGQVYAGQFAHDQDAIALFENLGHRQAAGAPFQHVGLSPNLWSRNALFDPERPVSKLNANDACARFANQSFSSVLICQFLR
jgi:hypothetical protein